MQGSHTTNDKPQLACEIGADRIVAARAAGSGGALEAHTTRRLASGALEPGLAAANIHRAEALREALRSALGDVAGKSHDVIAILPDASVRVLLLDFDALPDDVNEALNVIRFRVRKSVPFNVDDAAVSYDVQKSGNAWRVIAALAPRAIVNEYENAFLDAGYDTGVIVPSVLATLGMVEVTGPTLLVKVDAITTTLALVDRDALLQVRTIELHSDSADAGTLAAQIHPTLVFHEDTFGAKVERIFLAGMSISPGLGAALQSECGLPVEEVSATGHIGRAMGDPAPHSMLTGVMGVFQA